MLLRSRGLIALAIVVSASLLALIFKGVTEWATDLAVSACAGIAGRIKTKGTAGRASRRPREASRRHARLRHHRLYHRRFSHRPAPIRLHGCH
jgi:hypothetical protein